MKQNSLENINFLKILFMVEVLLYHFIRKMGVWNNGGYAVEFFFMVSGYLLATQSVFDRRYLTVGDFLWGKIKRFFPLVVVISLIGFLFGKSLSSMFNNLVFSLNIWGLSSHIAWYLNVLIWVSAFYFCLIKHVAAKYVDIIIGVLCLISWIVLQQMDFVRINRLGPGGSIGWYMPSALLTGILCMGIGYFLSFLNIREEGKKSWGVTILEIGFLLYPLVGMAWHKLYISAQEIVVAEIILLVLFLKSRGYLSTWLNQIAWHRLSRYTLAIYVLQDTSVTYLFDYFFKQYPEMMKQHVFLSSCGVIMAAVFIGIVGYYFIQKPAEKVLNRLPWGKRSELVKNNCFSCKRML